MHNRLNLFIDDVLVAIASFNPEVGKVQKKESKDRLQKILNVNSLAAAAKAFAVLTDDQRALHDARILTDIRFAFKADPSSEPYGAVIVHNLKLTYHEAGDHKEFFVALDDDDLDRLLNVIRRAQVKGKSLRQTITKAGIEYLGKINER